jgi:release factor glutamine methyltransferase
MATVAQLLRSAADLPGESARREGEILLCACVHKPRSWLYAWPEATIPDEAAAQFARLLAARRAGQPIAYILGEREFWSLTLKVTSATLIPRPETEALVAWALELPLPRHATVLEMGTGSGAIALALASERCHWQITATDSSVDALAVARANARSCALDAGVTFLQSDWYAGLGRERFDLVCSNPPYICPDDAHLQNGDLRFEPLSALAAAEGGMADLRCIVSAARDHLNDNGWLLVEHGFEQGEAVRTLFALAGFSAITTRRDLAGLERTTGGCNNAQ